MSQSAEKCPEFGVKQFRDGGIQLRIPEFFNRHQYRTQHDLAPHAAFPPSAMEVELAILEIRPLLFSFSDPRYGVALIGLEAGTQIRERAKRQASQRVEQLKKDKETKDRRRAFFGPGSGYPGAARATRKRRTGKRSTKL